MMKRTRLLLSILLPLFALALQWLLWPWISPFVWFLFFPTVFFSARLGGFKGGLVSTFLSAGLVWYFFIPPQMSWAMDKPANFYSVGMFLIMGYLFSDTHGRLRTAQQNTESALAQTSAAKEEITQLYQKSLELDRLKTEFFANISHELRTPLTLIISPLTRRLALDSLSAAERGEDELILRNARLLYRQVSDLLDVAKLEAGHMAVDYAYIDLGELTRAVASQFDSLAKEKNISYCLDVPVPIRGEADGEKIQRVLLNLLANAFKFTPDGGNIRVTLRENAGMAVIMVEDNGPGIPEDMREVVFERFRQVEGGAQRRFGGTGLGLAIVKEFTELHLGSVTLNQAVDGGALFSVSLPLQAPSGTLVRDTSTRLDPNFNLQSSAKNRSPSQQLRATTVVDADDANTPLILVVEDNADMNAFIVDTLQPYYRVASAYDGREGLALARNLRPDLILCDLMMPLMSGDQMVIELRRQQILLDVPIVMLTAKAEDEQRVRMLNQGVQDYINKPFLVDELLARIHGLIEVRQRNAAKLSASERRFEATFEQAAVGIALVAPDGRWLRVNRKLCEIVAYSHDELLALSFQDITHPDDLETDMTYLQQLLAGEIPNYSMEKRYIRKGGELIWINLTVALVRSADASSNYFISVIEDITERKLFEESLNKSQAQLKTFIQHAPISIAMFDKEMNYLSVSGRWLADFGSGQASLMGLNYYQVNPDMPANWRDIHQQGLSGATINNDEDLWVQADGTMRWLRWVVSPWSDENAAIGGVIISIEDISDRKLAKEEIRRLNNDLEQRVLARTAELSAANQELDSFAYAVSHDLRAPLRAMSGFSQALSEDYGDQLPGDAQVFLKQIQIASSKMSELIDGLLVLSRTTRGVLAVDRIDLSTLGEKILADLQRDWPERRLDIDVEAGMLANGDKRMIEALLRNLLENAWKYTANTQTASIRFYSEQLGGKQRFCISDNGAGFDMVHAGRLFQPFQRLHRQDEFPGIGIGLATVQRIVFRHGGTIEASGEPGKGAVFCFTLPELIAGSVADKQEVV
ncbi:ATP-binding protein [Methylomonas albis]|uniref:histidine kinase n=1 Tax=Methylomonas albis TaxID=1854563 RepID=A0ABR9D2F5_9GAMM|nr:ATP-binding protein [Methylomonas albis]MBD9357210.1 PAS domain S-box protein [Methylomonas albis]